MQRDRIEDIHSLTQKRHAVLGPDGNRNGSGRQLDQTRLWITLGRISVHRPPLEAENERERESSRAPESKAESIHWMPFAIDQKHGYMDIRMDAFLTSYGRYSGQWINRDPLFPAILKLSILWNPQLNQDIALNLRFYYFSVCNNFHPQLWIVVITFQEMILDLQR